MSDAFAKFFLPYQRAWLADRSRFKIARKSRRVGLTYAQSFEDVRDAAKQDGMDVWFSSADESAAKEYIRYCGVWAKLLDIGARDLGEIVIDEKNAIKALSIEFANGRRINALTSNPKAFRSKGGKLVLDEFAFHGDGDAMWKAARPIITWGYPVRIISTLNGKSNRYYRIISDTEKQVALGKQPLFSLHTITIQQAVADGLADKIVGRPLSQAEREKWLADEKEAVGDEDTWRQEYCCEVIDDDGHWLDWQLITACESDEAGRPELYAGGLVTIGWDVARRRDGSILWVREKVGDVGWTREVVSLGKVKFEAQFAELRRLFETYNVKRLAIDQTGMGEKVVEDAQAEFGAYRVEGVLFTNALKHDLAITLRQEFEDRRARIPVDRRIRDAHYAVRKTTTTAGNPRFDAERTEAGHADEFWAHALAIHAEDLAPPAAGATVEAEPDTYQAARPDRPEGGRMFVEGRGRRSARSGAPGRRGR